MYIDPYLGIKKPRILFKDVKQIDANSYISVNFCEMNRINYYEVIYQHYNKEVFFEKYYKSDLLLDVLYKDDKILVFTKEYNREKYKMEIVEVLALYDTKDDVFCYRTEEDALKNFDNNVSTLYLKNKTKKILLTHIRKRTLVSVANIIKDSKKSTESIDISNFCLDPKQEVNTDIEVDKQKTKIIKLLK